jgi:hypothetical protein
MDSTTKKSHKIDMYALNLSTLKIPYFIETLEKKGLAHFNNNSSQQSPHQQTFSPIPMNISPTAISPKSFYYCQSKAILKKLRIKNELMII